MNILIIVIEVCVLVFTFILLNVLIDVSLHYVNKVSWLKRKVQTIINQRQNIKRFLMFNCSILCLLMVGMNGLLLYQGQNILEYQLKIIGSIPPQFWLVAIGGIIKTVILIFLVNYTIPIIHRGLYFACDRAQNFDDITGNDESISIFFSFLKSTITNSIWIFVVILCGQFFQTPAVVINYLYIALECYVILSVGLLLVKVISTIIITLDELTTNTKDGQYKNIANFYLSFKHLIYLLKKAIEYVIYISIGVLIARKVDFLNWLVPYGLIIINIIGIFLLSSISIQVANKILEDIVLKTDDLTELQRQRRLTIIPLFKSILKYIIYFMAAISVLKLIGIDPTPILAGAGIIGLAVGFGAQNLINDIVCGFFILFENYYLVGDYIEINQASGIVEAIDLRSTRIRHFDGQVYIVRNGEIKDVINYSKHYIYAVVEVNIMYNTDIEQVYTVIEKLGKELKENNPEVLEPTRVDGLEKFADYYLVIRTATKVKPGNKFPIERLFRKMIKYAFDHEGIEIGVLPPP